MSNTDFLLAGYEAWNRGDREAWLALLDPEIQIKTSGAFPDLAPEYRGHKRAAKFWSQMLEPWEEFHIEVERIEEESDIVAAGIRFRARGSDSGVEVDMRLGSRIRIRDRLAIELLNRRTFEEAFEALRQGARDQARVGAQQHVVVAVRDLLGERRPRGRGQVDVWLTMPSSARNVSARSAKLSAPSRSQRSSTRSRISSKSPAPPAHGAPLRVVLDQVALLLETIMWCRWRAMCSSQACSSCLSCATAGSSVATIARASASSGSISSSQIRSRAASCFRVVIEPAGGEAFARSRSVIEVAA